MSNMGMFLIKNGHIIDPAQNIDRPGSVLIQDGTISAILGPDEDVSEADILDADGSIVCPGFIDLHCHLREPGFEYKETIASGTLAAARGGFTTICAMPNTNPVADTRSTVDFITSRADKDGCVRVLPIGAVTMGSRGERLVEMGELAEAGVIGFSDDGLPVSNSNIMRQALSYSSTFGLPIINHCEERSLSIGSMSEGWVSNRLGLLGNPNSAEEVMVARDIGLARLTRGRLHIAHASTAGTIEMVRRSAQEGLNVTCEATPHHLTLSEEAVLGEWSVDQPFEPLGTSAYDTNAKVAPPLRTRADVASLVQGLKDGAIDFIATDHAPHATVDKLTTFDKAANGISSLETALGSLMTLVHNGDISLRLLIEKLTAAPARFLGRDLGSLKQGGQADVTVFDPNREWIVNPNTFVSKGKNTPLSGVALKGLVVATIVAGDVVYQQNG